MGRRAPSVSERDLGLPEGEGGDSSVLALGAGEQTTRSKGWSELRRYLAADLPPGADPQAVTDVHRWGFAYFDGPLEAMEAKAIQAEDAERLHRALRHA
jgi:hypothetical protein